jgi:AAA family ATP:ADP antiporter
MSNSPSPEFGKLRSFFWPVYRHELRKLIPMLFIFFFVCLNYSILRNIKDALVVTAQSSGAEVIPFIKVWVLLPMAVCLTYLFTRLYNRFSQEKVFYIMLSIFLSFFALFTFILYPMRDSLHPHALADSLQEILPLGCKGLIAMFRNWTFTAFYVMSELWGSAVLSVLCWGIANQITHINEAGRFYSLFGVGSNISAIVAGLLGVYFATGVYDPNLPFGKDAWEQTLTQLVSIVIVTGFIVMLIFRWMAKHSLVGESGESQGTGKFKMRSKSRLSFKESLIYLSKSRYLISIAVVMVSYNLVINLAEVVWKDQLRTLYPSASDYNAYVNKLTSIMGIISTMISFSTAKIIQRYGWTRTAFIPPTVILITSTGFFSFLFFQESSIGDYIVAFTGTIPLAIAVFFGSAQNVMSKATKYSIFDATKEMAFIPLSQDTKLKGKAVIDGIGSRFGKSGGALIHQSLLMIFFTLSASAPYVAGFLLVVILFWMAAVKNLGRQFQELVSSGRSGTERSEPEAATISAGNPEPELAKSPS